MTQEADDVHVPEHLINDPVEAAAAVSAVAVLGAAAVRRGSTAVERGEPPTMLERPERPAALAATASLVFALQMVNFPVLPGTSGHLLGGALATALIGPRRALFAVSAVVISQAVVFADGGIGALGVNLWLIAIVPVALTAVVQRMLLRSSASAGRRVGVASLAALLGPPVSSVVFVVLFGLGGTTAVGLGEVARSMVGVHLAIGAGEAAVTAAVLVAVVMLSIPGGLSDRSAADRHGQARRPVLSGTWAVAALAVVAAGALSLAASSQPDGLERVAGDLGFAIDGPGSILHGSPLADYQLAGLDGWLSGSLAGMVGLFVTCAIAAALGGLAGSRDADGAAGDDGAALTA